MNHCIREIISPDISMEQYCRLLIESIKVFYKNTSSFVNIITNFDDIRLPVDYAIPTGLIINELITNCMKYAFKGMSSGEKFW